MKKTVSVFVLCIMALPAFALTPAGQGRRTMSAQVDMAPRATASVNQIQAMSASVTKSEAEADKSSIRDNVSATIPAVTEPETPVVDTREKEKLACISNNIGIGNTFVWASRYSNVANYSSMIEDVENPDNNVCFVKVELRSDDRKINVSDVPSQYYEMGRVITCGEWANEGTLKKRILDAKKSGRTWATVGGAVGGAAVGVGAMELFGNKAINGKVEGQKSKKLSDNQKMRSWLLANKGSAEYNDFMRYMKTLKDECKSDIWEKSGTSKPEDCESYDYEYFLDI